MPKHSTSSDPYRIASLFHNLNDGYCHFDDISLAVISELLLSVIFEPPLRCLKIYFYTLVVSIKQSRRIHIPCNDNLDVFFHFVRSVRHVEILNRVKYRGMIFCWWRLGDWIYLQQKLWGVF